MRLMQGKGDFSQKWLGPFPRHFFVSCALVGVQPSVTTTEGDFFLWRLKDLIGHRSPSEKRPNKLYNRIKAR